MVRHAVLSTLVLLISVASLSGAHIQFGVTGELTPGLPGYATHTIRAFSSHPMQGFDFAGDGSNNPVNGKGFFASMNQINPAGQPTVYSDNNPIIIALGGNPKQDSQFLVRTGDVVVPAGFAEEGPNILQGLWAHAAPVGLSFDIAQLVIPITGGFELRGTISTLEGMEFVENNVHLIWPPAEPTSAIVAGLAAVGLLLFRRRRA